MYLLHFTENDITFAADAIFLKSRILKDVGEDVEGLGDVAVGNLGVICGLFA